MKILCLQQSSVFETYGGIEYYLHDLLTFTQEILGPGSITTLVPQRKGPFTLFPTEYQVVPIPYHLSGKTAKFENRFSPRMVSHALSISRKEKPDLIWVGHVSLAPLGYALSKILGIPYWTVAYGVEVWGGLSIPVEWALRQSQAIISISHWTKNILTARGFQENDIHVIHPCLTPGFEEKPLKKFSSDTQKPLKLLTISRLDASEQYKGHDHVLMALGKIKKINPSALPHYTIQGEGSDRERLEQLVFYGGLQEHVTFLGRTKTREELEQLYLDSDLFVMPSRFGCWDGKWRGEGFGIVYAEAAAFGVPCIAYRCGGVTDIIQSEKTGFLVEPDNIEALAELILRLHHNRDLIAQWGKEAQQHVRCYFSHPNMKAQIARALSSSQSIAEICPSSDSIDVSDVVNTLS